MNIHGSCKMVVTNTYESGPYCSHTRRERSILSGARRVGGGAPIISLYLPVHLMREARLVLAGCDGHSCRTGGWDEHTIPSLTSRLTISDSRFIASTTTTPRDAGKFEIHNRRKTRSKMYLQWAALTEA